MDQFQASDVELFFIKQDKVGYNQAERFQVLISVDVVHNELLIVFEVDREALLGSMYV